MGRAISREDEKKLIEAISRSRSPTLLPLFFLSIDTGLRAAEVRALRRKDLQLSWKDGVIERSELVVPKSTTEGGTGRIVPLTSRVCAVLSLWLSRLGDDPEGYIFPAHKIGLGGNDRKPTLYAVDHHSPMVIWKKAWQVALRRAGLDSRWHDTRHSFISRFCENPSISEQTIIALAGHVSKRMPERYSHIRAQAKREAIATLETTDFEPEGVQKWAQSVAGESLN